MTSNTELQTAFYNGTAQGYKKGHLDGYQLASSEGHSVIFARDQKIALLEAMLRDKEHERGEMQMERDIAQQDLEIRGPGELLGTKQTGLADLKIADLIRDAELIPQVQNIANHLWEQYPSNAQAIVNRWLGNKENFGHA